MKQIPSQQRKRSIFNASLNLLLCGCLLASYSLTGCHGISHEELHYLGDAELEHYKDKMLDIAYPDICVTTPQEVAVVDAVKAMNMFLLPNVNVPIMGVVENMSWFTPEELPNNKYHIFGEGGGKKLAKMSNSMLLGQVPLVQGVREGGDKGVPIAMQDGHPLQETFKDIALKTIRQIHIRNEVMPPTQIVEMKTGI